MTEVTEDWPHETIEQALIVREALGCEVTLSGSGNGPTLADVTWPQEEFWTEIRTDGGLWAALVSMCQARLRD